MADPEVQFASSVVLDHVGCLDSGTADASLSVPQGVPASPRIDLTAPWEPTVGSWTIRMSAQEVLK